MLGEPWEGKSWQRVERPKILHDFFQLLCNILGSLQHVLLLEDAPSWAHLNSVHQVMWFAY